MSEMDYFRRIFNLPDNCEKLPYHFTIMFYHIEDIQAIYGKYRMQSLESWHQKTRLNDYIRLYDWCTEYKTPSVREHPTMKAVYEIIVMNKGCIHFRDVITGKPLDRMPYFYDETVVIKKIRQLFTQLSHVSMMKQLGLYTLLIESGLLIETDNTLRYRNELLQKTLDDTQ